MIEIRCPGTILTKENKVYPCNALLCKASEGSKIEVVCKRCKTKMVIVVKPGLGSVPTVAIRQINK